MSRVLLTGAGGFVGSHVFEHILAKTDWTIAATDSFRHKGRCDRLARIITESPDGDAWRERLTLLTHDLVAPFTAAQAQAIGSPDVVIAMASESHVDRSIADPVPFVRNNVDLMLNTLELCRELKPRMVLVISSDEVYGPVEPGGAYLEWAPILPSNPYSASKAAQEAFAISYWRTYGVPVVIVNCMNMIGEMQDPEKFAPMVIRKVQLGETVSIHGRPGNVGSRHYLHARNLADALVFLVRRTIPAMFPTHVKIQPRGKERPFRLADRPDRYNIAGPAAISNLDLAQAIADVMGRPLDYELTDFHSARPGHDPHYGLDSSKLASLGWRPPVEFWESMERMVRWTVKHPEWLA